MTLYCPECGYNLTGLPENRCPECGQEFDPQALERLEKAAPKPIGLGRATIQLFWPPMTAVLLLYYLAVIGLGFPSGVPVTVVVAIAFLGVYGFYNSMRISQRLLARPPSGEKFGERKPRPAGAIVGLTFGLYLVQWIVAAAGCAACVLSSLA